MKKIIALGTTLLLLSPAFALAEQGRGGQDDIRPEAELHGGIKAEISHTAASSSNRGASSNSGPGKPVQALRTMASSTREELRGGLKGMASTTRELKGIASSTRAFIRAKIDAAHALIEKRKGENEKRADIVKEKAKARFGEKVEKLVGNISARLASTTQALVSIADRADARIEVLMDQGHPMTEPSALLAQARTDIAAAQAKILAVNAALDATVSTTTPKAELPAVRAAVKAAEDALRTAKESLQKTLRSIKAEGGASAQATTTVSNH